MPQYRGGGGTELCDGNYHRNKTILSWSNGMTSLNRKYMVFPLKDQFITENGLLTKNKVNDRNTSKISVPTEHFDQF